MKKAIQIIFLGIVAVLLVLPAATIQREEPYISPMDNKLMSAFPERWWENLSQVEDYVNDRIGFRDGMITANQRIDYVLFGEVSHPLYQAGKEGQVFTREWDPVTYQHLDVTDGFPEAMTRFLLHLQEYCGERDIAFCFLLAPSKETVYGEYYPDGYGIQAQPNRTDLLMEELHREGVNAIDPREGLQQAKAIRPVYNQKYDAGHWNSYGMFVSVKKLYDDFLLPAFPTVEELKEEDYTVEPTEHPYLPLSYFPIHDTEEALVLSSEEASLEADSGVAEFYSMKWVNETRPDAPRILIFGDSYFGHSGQYFTNHFSEVTLLHVENMWDFYGCVERIQPDVVVIEACEWVLDTHRYSMFDWKPEVFELFMQ